MKKKDLAGFKQKSDVELVKEIEEQEAELVKLKMEFATGKLKDMHQVTKKRHDLARLKTLLRQRQLTAELVSHQREEGK